MAGLTQEQAADLVEWAGSKNAAAAVAGVPRSTFRYWVNPEPDRARMSRNYVADPEAKCAAMREHYENLTGVEYARKLLRQRRHKALRRKAQREQRRATVGPLP